MSRSPPDLPANAPSHSMNRHNLKLLTTTKCKHSLIAKLGERKSEPNPGIASEGASTRRLSPQLPVTVIRASLVLVCPFDNAIQR
jgi:hypothetical protein